MKIDCISDLHGFQPKLEGGDLLIVAGDLTARDMTNEYLSFNTWLSAQKYDRKIVIAGNHDGRIEKGVYVEVLKDHMQRVVPILANGAIYLQDSGCVYEGLKIWGSPWTPAFFNWHFMKDRGEDIKAMWDLIPDDIDILITHGPPYDILDECLYSSKANNGNHAGCEELLKAVCRVKPRLHVFGHIHESPGIKTIQWDGTDKKTTFVNACIMDIQYYPKNPVISVEI